MTVSPPINPITCLIEGNGSLAGRDRAGAFSAIGSGALRYAPAPGARVNLAANPQMTSGITRWGGSAGTETHSWVTDARFYGGHADRVVCPGAIDAEGISQPGASTPLNAPTYAASHDYTLSFDIIVESGRLSGLIAQIVLRDAAGTTITTRTLGTFSVAGYEQLTRVSVTGSVPAATMGGADKISARVINGAVEACQFLISNIVLEYGSVPSAQFFDGPFVNPRTGQLGTPDNSPSVSRAQFWVEEGTTQLVPNPWRAIDNTGWAALNGSTARSTAYAFQGPGSGLLTASAANAEEYISVTAAASSHTAQAIVRNNAVGSRQCQLTYNGSLIGSPVSVAAGALQAITAAFTGTGVAANLGVRWIDSVNTNTFVTYYLGAEAKAYATSPCPAIDASGTVISGYTWAGTAHASASTRAAGRVYVSGSTGRFNTITGSMLTRAFATSRTGTSVNRVLQLGNYQGVSGDSYGLLASTSASGSVGQFNTVGLSVDGSVTYAAAGSFPDGVSRNLYLSWTASQRRLGLLNGTLVAVTKNIAAIGNVPPGVPYLQVMSDYNADGSRVNGYAGPVVHYESDLSDARRAMVNAAIDSNGATDLWTLFEEWETVLSPVDLFDLEALAATVGVVAEFAPLDMFALDAGAVSSGVTAILEPLDFGLDYEDLRGVSVIPLPASISWEDASSSLVTWSTD